MSQPPLSRQLNQLEEELGVTLFTGGKRKIELTEEAKGTLLIGVTETCSASVLPVVLPQFKQRYPKIR